MEGKRDRSVDAVRGFAILLVMLGHCIVLNHMEDGYLYDAIKAVQMPLFMAVSGFVLGRRELFITAQELGRQTVKRAVSCLVPFVSWIFVTNVTDFPAKLIRVLYQPDTGLWFLLTLFLLSVMVYLALFVKDGLHGGWIGFDLVILAEAVLLALYYLSGNTFLGPALAINYFPFFVGGFFAGKLWGMQGTGEDGKYRKRLPGWIEAVCGVLFVFLVIKYDMVYAGNRLEWLIQLAASALGSFVCFCLIYHLREGRIKKSLSFVGTYTLEIYVLHFRFARILGMQDAGLSLYSLKGVCVVVVTFVLMSVLTAFFILVFKQLAVTDLLLFGKVRKKKGMVF